MKRFPLPYPERKLPEKKLGLYRYFSRGPLDKNWRRVTWQDSWHDLPKRPVPSLPYIASICSAQLVALLELKAVWISDKLSPIMIKPWILNMNMTKSLKPQKTISNLITRFMFNSGLCEYTPVPSAIRSPLVSGKFQ